MTEHIPAEEPGVQNREHEARQALANIRAAFGRIAEVGYTQHQYRIDEEVLTGSAAYYWLSGDLREIRYDTWRNHDMSVVPREQIAPEIWDALLDRGQLVSGGVHLQSAEHHAYVMGADGRLTYVTGKVENIVAPDGEGYKLSESLGLVENVSEDGRIGSAVSDTFLDKQHAKHVDWAVDWLLE